MGRTVRRTALNLGLVIISLVVSLVIAEMALRGAGTFGVRSGALRPAARPFQLTPRTTLIQPDYAGVLTSRDFSVAYRTDSLGFREREFDPGRLATQQPYLFVGDSYINGWGVDVQARISEQLAARLATEGENVPVLNLSAPALGTYQYLDIVRQVGIKAQPRLVIVGFFVGNDFIDDSTTRQVKAGQTVATGTDPPPRDLSATLRGALKDSAIVNLAKYALWNNAAFRATFDRLDLKNDRIALYEPSASRLQDDLYAGSFAAWDAFKTLADQEHVRILVLILPDHLQVLRPELFAGLDYDRPQRLLKSHLDQLGLPYFDLLEVFRQYPHPETLFFREDKHWTAAGHALAAAALAEHLQEDRSNLTGCAPQCSISCRSIGGN